MQAGDPPHPLPHRDSTSRNTGVPGIAFSDIETLVQETPAKTIRLVYHLAGVFLQTELEQMVMEEDARNIILLRPNPCISPQNMVDQLLQTLSGVVVELLSACDKNQTAFNWCEKAQTLLRKERCHNEKLLNAIKAPLLVDVINPT